MPCAKPVFMASSRLLLFFSAIFVIAATPVAQSDFLYHFCANDKGNYTPNSTYESNLNLFLSLLSSKTQIDNGFYNSSYGQNSNKVHVIGLCRGDVNPDICRDCLHNATSLLTKSCPDQKEAIGWYNECMLRYSNRSTFGIMETSPGFTMWGVNSVSVNFTHTFYDVVRTSLKSLRSQAAAGGSARKFAAKNATLPNYKTLYALVQCTPDLTEQDCDDCLRGASEGVPQSDGKEGGLIVRPSCAIRFEVYPFNNSTPDWSTASPTVSPPLSSPSASSMDATSAEGRNDSNVVLRSLTCILLLLAFLVLFSIMGFYRNETTSGKKVQTMDVIRHLKSLEFDFITIKVATDNFSEANKLVEDEFGVVYKGMLSDKVVAVKKIFENTGHLFFEDKEALQMATKLRHRNIVGILGFCDEGNDKLLVYDFVPNRSLDQFLSDPIQRADFTWEMRYKIIKGVAEGIRHLHQNRIHYNLKASDILLDEEMNPKIPAFGRENLFLSHQSQDQKERSLVGTKKGCLVSQNEMLGLFFNFGVLVFQIVTGQRNNISFQNGEIVEDLVSYVWRNWREETTTNIVDRTLAPGSTTHDEIKRCIQIGLLCLQEDFATHTSMDSIVLMLNHYSVDVPAPVRPSAVEFLRLGSIGSESSSGGEHRIGVTVSTLLERQPKRHQSLSDETLSNLQPRKGQSLRSFLNTTTRKLSLKLRCRIWGSNRNAVRDNSIP